MRVRIILLRRFFFWGALVFTGILLVYGGLCLGGVSNPIASVLADNNRQVPIYAVDIQEKKLAISFDAAWGADQTSKLLEILDTYKVKTTFFLTGIWVEKYPEMVKEIAARGHEIGNHSNTHPHCAALSPEEIKKELQINEDMIYELTGQRTKLFRPPFGEYNNKVINTAEEMGYKVIQWSIDSLDWQDLEADAIVKRVLKDVQPGAIVLFHNNALHTPEAVPVILKALKEKDFQIVPISDLLLKEDYYIERHTGIQKKKP